MLRRSRKALSLLAPPRNGFVEEPVNVRVVLENRLSVPLELQDLQLVPIVGDAAAVSGEGGAVIAVEEEEFRRRCVDSSLAQQKGRPRPYGA